MIRAIPTSGFFMSLLNTVVMSEFSDLSLIEEKIRVAARIIVIAETTLGKKSAPKPVSTISVCVKELDVTIIKVLNRINIIPIAIFTFFMYSS